WGYVVFTVVNFLLTIGGLLLVDRSGRKFLLTLGSAGIIISLGITGGIFRHNEQWQVDRQEVVQSMVGPDQTLALRFDTAEAQRLLAASGAPSKTIDPDRASLVVVYSYGGFTAE